MSHLSSFRRFVKQRFSGSMLITLFHMWERYPPPPSNPIRADLLEEGAERQPWRLPPRLWLSLPNWIMHLLCPIFFSLHFTILWIQIYIYIYVDETIYLLSKSRKLVVRHNNRSGLWFVGIFHNLWHTRVSNTLNTICQFHLTNRHSVFVERNAQFNRWKKLTWKYVFYFIIGSIFDMLRKI